MKGTTVWRRGVTSVVGLALVLIAGDASAQRGEVRQDRREIRRDRMDVVQDRADVARLSNLITRLDRAQARMNRVEERRLRASIHTMLDREIAEARHDLQRDRREEYRNMRPTGRDADVRRDIRDDRRDTVQSRRQLERLMSIRADWERVEPAARNHDRRGMRQEDRLLASFLRLARQDAVRSGRELNEDRRELREDRSF